MPGKFAIDFGTTNTVVARWNEATGAAETVRLDDLSLTPAELDAPVVPSQLYVRNAAADDALVGRQVRAAGLNTSADPRYFSAFKRPLVAEIQGLPREMDGRSVGFPDAGRLFLRTVLGRLAARGHKPGELVLTVPVDSFERYAQWLEGVAGMADADVVHAVDESTAAALGYDAARSDAVVLVFDFGGGTLDVSIVRLGRLGSADEVGAVLRDKRGKGRGTSAVTSKAGATARVIAKAGAVLGGEDVDQWLVEDLLARCGTTTAAVAPVLNQIKASAEEVKIRLSRQDAAELAVFDPENLRTYAHNYTRAEFEALLESRGFYRRIQECLRKALRQAEAAGVTEESVHAVLLVGGTSLIPSVQRAVGQNFDAGRIRPHLPFEAVAHGALRIATGTALDDHLHHGYGIRHYNPITRVREYEPILKAGTRYPSAEPITQVLAAAWPDQAAIELVVCELTEDAAVREVVIEEGRIVSRDADRRVRKVVPLNDREGARTVAVLDPVGVPGVDRIKVAFTVDAKRCLRITVDDLKTRRRLLDDVKVIELR